MGIYIKWGKSSWRSLKWSLFDWKYLGTLFFFAHSLCALGHFLLRSGLRNTEHNKTSIQQGKQSCWFWVFRAMEAGYMVVASCFEDENRSFFRFALWFISLSTAQWSLGSMRSILSVEMCWRMMMIFLGTNATGNWKGLFEIEPHVRPWFQSMSVVIWKVFMHSVINPSKSSAAALIMSSLRIKRIKSRGLEIGAPWWHLSLPQFVAVQARWHGAKLRIDFHRGDIIPWGQIWANWRLAIIWSHDLVTIIWAEGLRKVMPHHLQYMVQHCFQSNDILEEPHLGCEINEVSFGLWLWHCMNLILYVYDESGRSWLGLLQALQNGI